MCDNIPSSQPSFDSKYAVCISASHSKNTATEGYLLASEEWQEAWQLSPKVQSGSFVINTKTKEPQKGTGGVHCLCTYGLWRWCSVVVILGWTGPYNVKVLINFCLLCFMLRLFEHVLSVSVATLIVFDILRCLVPLLIWFVVCSGQVID